MKTMCPPFPLPFPQCALPFLPLPFPLVHWYQQCVTVHHVPKCMSCHKAIVVITGRAHCFQLYLFKNERVKTCQKCVCPSTMLLL